jgi:hypothetical protein
LGLEPFPAGLRALLDFPPIVPSSDSEARFLKNLGVAEHSHAFRIDDKEAAGLILDFIAERKLTPADFWLGISLTTNSSIDGIDLPNHLVEFIASTHCSVKVYVSVVKGSPQ